MQTAYEKIISCDVTRFAQLPEKKKEGIHFSRTDETTCLTVRDFSHETTESFPLLLGDQENRRDPYAARTRKLAHCDDLPSLRLVIRHKFISSVYATRTRDECEHHCIAKVGEDTGGPMRWWEYTCTTVLHENSYPPWQAGRQASRQAGEQAGSI